MNKRTTRPSAGYQINSVQTCGRHIFVTSGNCCSVIPYTLAVEFLNIPQPFPILRWQGTDIFSPTGTEELDYNAFELTYHAHPTCTSRGWLYIYHKQQVLIVWNRSKNTHKDITKTGRELLSLWHQIWFNVKSDQGYKYLIWITETIFG